jgi:type I restriction enzyme, S subunit
VSKSQYGVTVKHLEAPHLLSVECPLLLEAEQEAIHNNILRAYTLRDEANDLLDEADELLHQELGLPRFDERLVPYLPLPPRRLANRLEMPHPRAFTVKVSDLAERLDASYHVPVVRTVIALLQKGKYPPVRLGGMAEGIFIPPRFKRIYVPKGYGVPFLRPSHLPQTRPYNLGYISKLTGVLDSLLLKKGDVLVTTDGTVGRIALVTTRIAGWAGSNNIARITYGNFDARNGYLAAFLSSPYGFFQLTREIYGGVVDHIEVPHLESVWTPDAPLDVQAAIGQRVAAFEKKDEATAIEEATIRWVETIVEKAAQ